MRTLALLVVVAACHGSAPPLPPIERAEDVDAGLFDALFDEGRAWTYDVSYADTVQQVHCTVSHVATISAELDASEVSCDDATSGGGEAPLDGVWARDDRGLWHLQDWPEGNDPLALAAFVLSRTPGDGHDDARPDDTEQVEVRRDGASWCATRSEPGVWTEALCFAHGEVVSGHSGTDEARTTFTLHR